MDELNCCKYSVDVLDLLGIDGCQACQERRAEEERARQERIRRSPNLDHLILDEEDEFDMVQRSCVDCQKPFDQFVDFRTLRCEDCDRKYISKRSLEALYRDFAINPEDEDVDDEW